MPLILAGGVDLDHGMSLYFRMTSGDLRWATFCWNHRSTANEPEGFSSAAKICPFLSDAHSPGLLNIGTLFARLVRLGGTCQFRVREAGAANDFIPAGEQEMNHSPAPPSHMKPDQL